MRIFNAAVGDPMLLDSVQGLGLLYQRIANFSSSGAQEASFPALTNGDPTPYTEFLVGLRLRRDPHSSQLRIADDRWLELSAPSVELNRFAQKFLGLTDGDHHHWYSSPVSLIIEADDWRAAHDACRGGGPNFTV